MPEGNCLVVRSNTTERGSKKTHERALFTQKKGKCKPSENNGEKSENHQRNGHGLRGFVNMAFGFNGDAGHAVESLEEQTKHVERCEASGDKADGPKGEVAVHHQVAVEGMTKNFVFAEEAREAWNAGYSQRRNYERN